MRRHSSPTLDIEALPARLAVDRDEVFPALVAGMTGPLFNGVFRLVGNRQDAEDLTQETFVRAYRALGRYPTDQVRDLRLRPWLWTIAVNLCRNHLRTRSRRVTTSPLDSVPEPVSKSETEREALDGADAEWTRRLMTLPLPMRTAVVLRHVLGYGYGEIAEATGRAEGTVKSDVHRGLDRLRQMMTDDVQWIKEGDDE